jgi:SAM-dependent methyltransferase
MREAYSFASLEIQSALKDGGHCLDCGANNGYWYRKLTEEFELSINRYYGIEWDKKSVETAQQNGLNVQYGNLNKDLPYENSKFTCIYALSVLEHLLNGCFFIKECHRTLKNDGRLILLTPNISTYFTAVLILAGKMPSSGPHPDSDTLLKSEELIKVRSGNEDPDTESDIPVHRHLVVFSYRVLNKYLKMIGFREVKGYGFGLYPFPNFIQPFLEKIDPYHCHQMVFVAKK